jgi:outer membrane protein TolC
MDRAKQQTIVAKRNLESSRLRVRESLVRTTAAVKQADWTFKATLANVTLQQRSLELAEELVRQNTARVDVGQMPPLDRLQAEAEVAQRRENLIRAKSTAGDAEDQLRRLIMDPADAAFWRVHLDPADEPTLGSVLPDVDAVAAGNFDARFDLERARKDLQNIVTNVEFFSDQKLPDVRFETSYRGSGLSTRFLRTGDFQLHRRNGAPRLWQCAGADVRQLLSNVERRSHQKLCAGAQFRRGWARASPG